MRPTAVLLVALASAAPAAARKSGIAGESGQGAATCNDCHSGGTAPMVQLSGPAMLEAGATATYRLTITGGAAVVGGLGVSVDDPRATLAGRADVTRTVGATQLVHDAPVPFTDGALSFEFDLTAPAEAGMLTLYAAGNSCDGDGTKMGDQAATTSLPVVVAAAAARSTSAPDPSAPASMQSGCTFAASPSPPASPWWSLAVVFAASRLRRREAR